MMKANELKRWANTLDDDQIVGIDDGGLTIAVVGSDAYLELGGMPEDEDNTYCRECGEHMFIEPNGVSHHGTPDGIDYDGDADHVAIAEIEQ